MLRRFAAALAVVGCALAAQAAASGPAAAQSAYDICANSAQDQGGLDACAAENAQAANRQLIQSYGDLARFLDSDGRGKLAASQKAWIAFRDEDCGFWRATGGAMAKVNFDNCVAQLSAARAKELDGWPPNASRDTLTPRN